MLLQPLSTLIVTDSLTQEDYRVVKVLVIHYYITRSTIQMADNPSLKFYIIMLRNPGGGGEVPQSVVWLLMNSVTH
jgi:hypothetical protein